MGIHEPSSTLLWFLVQGITAVLYQPVGGWSACQSSWLVSKARLINETSTSQVNPKVFFYMRIIETLLEASSSLGSAFFSRNARPYGHTNSQHRVPLRMLLRCTFECRFSPSPAFPSPSHHRPINLLHSFQNGSHGIVAETPAEPLRKLKFVPHVHH